MFLARPFANIDPIRFEADVAGHGQAAHRALLRLLSVGVRCAKKRAYERGEKRAATLLEKFLSV
jgi:hypothetical protein